MQQFHIPKATHVAIVGGGCAGLAAAVTLAEQGVPVSVFESSPHWGGRARGVDWQGLRIDNGQHILIGGYRETLHLMQTVGVDIRKALMRLPLQLIMHDQFQLKTMQPLPAPLHMLAGLLTAKGLRWRERWAAARFMAWLKRNRFQLPTDMPLAALCAEHDQPETLIKLLWEPLCLAALNTPLVTASAQTFLNVLRDSFDRTKSDSDLLLPQVDLGQLISEPAARHVEMLGGELHPNCNVERVIREHGRFYLMCDLDRVQHYSHVILATPAHRLPRLSVVLPQLESSVALAESLTYQPIYTVYLQYGVATELPAPMIGFTTGTMQWVFDRGQLLGQAGLLAVVISAEGAHQDLSHEQLAEKVQMELAMAFPKLGTLKWHKVIAEKRATFSCEAGVKRPHQLTNVPNLYLAGDYTAGDYPATIEGAVQSGVKCAQHILGQFARR